MLNFHRQRRIFRGVLFLVVAISLITVLKLFLSGVRPQFLNVSPSISYLHAILEATMFSVAGKKLIRNSSKSHKAILRCDYKFPLFIVEILINFVKMWDHVLYTTNNNPFCDKFPVYFDEHQLQSTRIYWIKYKPRHKRISQK